MTPGGSAEQEELYRRALRLHPSEPQALRALGDLYQLQGRYDAALALADAAIAAEPDAPDGWPTPVAPVRPPRPIGRPPGRSARGSTRS